MIQSNMIQWKNAGDHFTAQPGLRVEYAWEGLLCFKSKVNGNGHRAMIKQYRNGKVKLMISQGIQS